MSDHAPGNGAFHVRLDVFEGPFQLLLGLISDRRVDVCDVPIAKLTEEYLAHLQAMAQMDLEPATEFLVVAATLLQLKARALVPAVISEETDPTDDVERDLLVARLLEVRTFQAAGAYLARLLATGDRRYPPAPARDDDSLRQMPTLVDIAPADLARVLVECIREQNRTVDTSLLVGEEEVSTQQAASELVERLRHGPASFRALAAGRSIAWAVAFFLAMLELGARGEVALGQAERLGDIEIELVSLGVQEGDGR